MTVGIMADRGIRDNIIFARDQLDRARKDGGCDQIMFWTRRVDQLLEQLSDQLSENRDADS